MLYLKILSVSNSLPSHLVYSEQESFSFIKKTSSFVASLALVSTDCTSCYVKLRISIVVPTDFFGSLSHAPKVEELDGNVYTEISEEAIHTTPSLRDTTDGSLSSDIGIALLHVLLLSR